MIAPAQSNVINPAADWIMSTQNRRPAMQTLWQTAWSKARLEKRSVQTYGACPEYARAISSDTIAEKIGSSKDLGVQAKDLACGIYKTTQYYR